MKLGHHTCPWEQMWVERQGRKSPIIFSVLCLAEEDRQVRKSHIQEELPYWTAEVNNLLIKNFWDLFPDLPYFEGPFLHGTSTGSRTRTFPEQVLTWTGMMPSLQRTRGSFSEPPAGASWSTGSSRHYDSPGTGPSPKADAPSPLIVKVRFLAAGEAQK